ncbi:50S ribosomal protein L16 [Candidatus Woesearchaeota archaeon]|nr:50S ribosomal protein L16 [Candidatus Woesearchaeota archaeon]
MAKLRKFVCYRSVEKPYTRKSKYTKKNFIKVYPSSKIQRFEGGDAARKFKYSVLVKVRESIQLRHNALEAARQSANKVLEKALGKPNYFIKMRVYPHHVLRENPLASGAGADRMSTGMSHSYGKNISSAAQLKVGQPVFEVRVDENGVQTAKKAMKRMVPKFPCACSIEIFDIKTGKQVFV